MMRLSVVLLAALLAVAASVPREGPESGDAIDASSGDCDVCPTGSTGAAHAAIRARHKREQAIADALERQAKAAAEAYPTPAAATGATGVAEEKEEEEKEEEVEVEQVPPQGRSWTEFTLDVVGADADTLKDNKDSIIESVLQAFDADLGITKDDITIVEVHDTAPVSPIAVADQATSFLQVDAPQLSSQVVIRVEEDQGDEGAVSNELATAIEDGTLQSQLSKRSLHAELSMNIDPKLKFGPPGEASSSAILAHSASFAVVAAVTAGVAALARL